MTHIMSLDRPVELRERISEFEDTPMVVPVLAENVYPLSSFGR